MAVVVQTKMWKPNSLRAARNCCERRTRRRSEGARMAETTVIRNADWLIAWNEPTQSHVYRRGCDIPFADGRITFVGKGSAGPAAREDDGRDRFVLTGRVNTHTHPTTETLPKGLPPHTTHPGSTHTPRT